MAECGSQLGDPSPLKMSELSKRRQLTGREEEEAPLSLPLPNCRNGQPTFYIFTRNWLGQLLGRIITEKMSTDQFNCYGQPYQQPTAGLENEHFQTKIFSQLTFRTLTSGQQGPSKSESILALGVDRGGGEERTLIYSKLSLI